MYHYTRLIKINIDKQKKQVDAEEIDFGLYPNEEIVHESVSFILSFYLKGDALIFYRNLGEDQTGLPLFDSLGGRLTNDMLVKVTKIRGNSES